MTNLDHNQPHDHEQPLQVPVLLKMLGHLAVYAYDHLPIHKRSMPLFGAMEQELVNQPQPLHPDIPTTVENIREVLIKHEVPAPKQLSFADKFTRSARMVQFTNRLTSHDQAFFEYSSMKELKDCFVASAQQQAHPLSFDQQLNIALKLAENDISSALTKLWFASRQYARWLDTVSILNLPDLTSEEILTELKEWRSSILACKNADIQSFQDTSGDSYYAWTHARARVMYGIDPGMANRIGKLIFEHGTAVNTHQIIKQSIPSNHKIAAAYGNRIGDAILDVISTE